MIQTRLVSNFWWHRDQICFFWQPFANIICESESANTYWLFRSMAEHFVVGNMWMILMQGFQGENILKHDDFYSIFFNVKCSWYFLVVTLDMQCICWFLPMSQRLSHINNILIFKELLETWWTMLATHPSLSGRLMSWNGSHTPRPKISKSWFLTFVHSSFNMLDGIMLHSFTLHRKISFSLWIEGTMETAVEHGKLPRHPACPCVVLPVYVASSQRAWKTNWFVESQFRLVFTFFTSQFDFSMLPVSSDSFWINCWAERTAS